MARNEVWSPPNLVTFVRLLATPWLGVLLARRDFSSSFPLLVVIGLTDFADGWLARRFHWQTRLGAILDPLADKLLAATAYLALGWSGGLPWWIVALVLGRDVLILAFSAWALARTSVRSLPPSVWGKISTFFQLCLAADALLAQAWPASPLAALLPVWLWSATAMTLLSGIEYLLTGIRLARARPEHSADGTD